MNIADLTKRYLFGSIDKSKIPGTLVDYNCELVIEQYEQGRIRTEEIYFKFTPKQPHQNQPFTLQVEKLLEPKNLIYSYRIVEKEGLSSSIIMGDRLQFKIQSTIKSQRKQMKRIEEISQSGDQYYQEQDILLRQLQFMKDFSQDQEEVESKYIEPSEVDKTSIKGLLIQFLNNQGNKKAKLKDIKQYLLTNSIKIAEPKLKLFLGELCQPGVDKKAGYSLKQQFVDQQYERGPRKIVKDQ